MQRNTTVPPNNDPNSIYSPQGQNTQNLQSNISQNQGNMTSFNTDMQTMQFQNVNQQALNNFNLNSLNQLAMRNRLQNLNNMNANNLNAMGMVNFNQMNMMNLMNNMNVQTAVMNNNGNLSPINNKNWNMNLNTPNNNQTMNYSNMSIPNIQSVNNNTDAINNNSLNSINMNNLQNPAFNNNFNISQSQINYMQPQAMNYMNYPMHQNPLNNNLRNEKNDSSNLINQAIKSQLAVRDMQNQAKIYASQRINQVKNETPKVAVGNFNTQPTAYTNQIKEESNLNAPTLLAIPSNKFNNTMNMPPMMKFNEKPPIMPPMTQANTKVELAKDAIRYDNSEHLQKRVAHYRYKDMKYQELVMQQGILNQKLYLERTKKNEDNLNLNLKFNSTKNPYMKNDRLPTTVVYDADKGPVFFRNVIKLHNTLKEIADEEEILVPIRLDLEIAGQRLCDTFTWNLNDRFISVELFVETLLKDLNLSNQAFFHPVTTTIKEQLKDYSQHGLNILNKLKEIKNAIDNKTELRIVIKLDITLGRVSLEDQFEWDVLNLENSPEKFALHLANDLGLGGEFKTAIAHSIREQIYSFHKSLSIIKYNFDGEVNDVNLVHSFLPIVNHPIRDKSNTESFTPILVEISEAELQRQAKIQERENRRTRRQQRAGRRGAILPEREPIRTTRTVLKSNIEFLSTTFPHGDPNALGGRAIKRSKDNSENLNVKRSNLGNSGDLSINYNMYENQDPMVDSMID